MRAAGQMAAARDAWERHRAKVHVTRDVDLAKLASGHDSHMVCTWTFWLQP